MNIQDLAIGFGIGTAAGVITLVIFLLLGGCH